MTALLLEAYYNLTPFFCRLLIGCLSSEKVLNVFPRDNTKVLNYLTFKLRLTVSHFMIISFFVKC